VCRILLSELFFPNYQVYNPSQLEIAGGGRPAQDRLMYITVLHYASCASTLFPSPSLAM
jgi:hypothetical protein